jgi:8-oxo-dGTP pyrophosphatase MutT (NUDIX family)
MTRKPPFDDPDAGPLQSANVRPRDAATLILLRHDSAAPRLLMGRRHRGHVFMPGKIVFPGGAVDRADALLRSPCTLRPQVAEKLCRGTTEVRARALALAAIRETFEETGLMLANPGEMNAPAGHESWQAFTARGAMPALDRLDYLARAITPPYRPRRFDARFFIADAAHVLGDPDRDLKSSGELEALDWLTLKQARDEELPSITRAVLDDLEARLANRRAPVPFYYFRAGRAIRREI